MPADAVGEPAKQEPEVVRGSSRRRAAEAVRTTVEDDAAVWADEVCKAGGLPARVGRRCGHVLVAEAAFERRAEPSLSTLGLQNPRSGPERWLVTHVLPMTAGELGDPFVLRVQMKTDDRTLHPVSVCIRPSPSPGRVVGRAGAVTRARRRRRRLHPSRTRR